MVIWISLILVYRGCLMVMCRYLIKAGDLFLEFDIIYIEIEQFFGSVLMLDSFLRMWECEKCFEHRNLILLWFHVSIIWSYKDDFGHYDLIWICCHGFVLLLLDTKMVAQYLFLNLFFGLCYKCWSGILNFCLIMIILIFYLLLLISFFGLAADRIHQFFCLNWTMAKLAFTVSLF